MDCSMLWCERGIMLGYPGFHELVECVRLLQKFPGFCRRDAIGHIVVNLIAFAAAGVKVDGRRRNTGTHSQLQGLKSRLMMPYTADTIACTRNDYCG